AELGAGETHAGKETDDLVLMLRWGGWRTVDGVHLLEQVAVVLRHTDNVGLATRRRPLAHEALEEPGAEGVELAHALHIDRHVLGFACLGGGAVHEPAAASSSLSPLSSLVSKASPMRWLLRRQAPNNNLRKTTSFSSDRSTHS